MYGCITGHLEVETIFLPSLQSKTAQSEPLETLHFMAAIVWT